MNIFKFILSLFQKKYFTGVIADPRTDEQKSHDYTHDEVAMAVASVYGTKIVESPYFLENQNQTSSCIPHGTTLALGIAQEQSGKTYSRLSKMFTYRRRTNYPAEGMWLQGAFDDLKNTGSCLYSSLSNVETEDEANGIVITQDQISEAEPFKGNEYYQFTSPYGIDPIATVAAQGTAIPIIIYATNREWSQKYPQLMDNPVFAYAPIRHCICVLPKGNFIEKGKKYVTIQDSAWFGSIQIRYVSEDFIKARCYAAGYWKSVLLQKGQGTKPIHRFIMTMPLMSIGSSGTEVQWLQKCLIFEGLLPADCVTGYFGGRTRAAVKAYQNEYSQKILSPLGLTQPTGVVGINTIACLNQTYGQ